MVVQDSFTVDNDTVVPVSASILTRSFAVVLGLIRTFRTKKRSSLGLRIRLLPERYDGCTFPYFLYLCIIVWTDERGTFRHLEIAPQDEPHLWMSTILFLMSWLISLDFPMMSKKEALWLRCAFICIHSSVKRSGPKFQQTIVESLWKDTQNVWPKGKSFRGNSTKY